MSTPLGLSVKRREDHRLLTGRGRFVDDLRLPELLHAAIVRSPHAHARVVEVDARAARALPGVVAVFTLADLPECAAAVPPLVASPRLRPYAQGALAGPKVRYAGEAVAVAVADDPYRAADAAGVVEIRYAVLPAATTVADALAPGAPRVFDEWPDNVAGPACAAVGDVTRGFGQARVVVETRLHVPRVAAMPIEPRGVVAQPNSLDGRLTVWASTQMPFAVRAAVATALGLAEEHVRVIAPDVGGGFGAKGHVYPEDVLIPAVARHECAPTDVVLAGGRAHVAGMVGRGVALGALPRASLRSPILLHEGAPGLHACAFFRPETVTWAFGMHACALEVDVETGAIRLLRYAAVHDCGRPLNPMIVEGQLHGGIVQGIGAALAEELIYDGQGQLVTGSFLEYGLPTAEQVPPLDVLALDFPSTRNELGIKGVGESGVISPVPAIANAVEDALADRGVTIARVPVTAASVWEALRDAGPSTLPRSGRV